MIVQIRVCFQILKENIPAAKKNKKIVFLKANFAFPRKLFNRQLIWGLHDVLGLFYFLGFLHVT